MVCVYAHGVCGGVCGGVCVVCIWGVCVHMGCTWSVCAHGVHMECVLCACGLCVCMRGLCMWVVWEYKGTFDVCGVCGCVCVGYTLGMGKGGRAN